MAAALGDVENCSAYSARADGTRVASDGGPATRKRGIGAGASADYGDTGQRIRRFTTMKHHSKVRQALVLLFVILLVAWIAAQFF